MLVLFFLVPFWLLVLSSALHFSYVCLCRRDIMHKCICVQLSTPRELLVAGGRQHFEMHRSFRPLPQRRGVQVLMYYSVPVKCVPFLHNRGDVAAGEMGCTRMEKKKTLLNNTSKMGGNYSRVISCQRSPLGRVAALN